MSSCSKKPEDAGVPLVPYEELRIVLLGKVRVGKSASGNTILGRNDLFPSRPGPFAVTTRCRKETREIGTQNVVVIDTPGLCKPEEDSEEVLREIKRSISLTQPGPHVFVIVLRVTERYTAEEEEVVEIICDTFGRDVMAYTMVLFTHGAELKTSRDEFIQPNKSLLRLITQCNWRCHVFDNENGSEDQVAELLLMINQQLQNTKRSFYTAEMLKEAETAFEKQQVENATGGGAPATPISIQTSAYSGLLAGCVMGYLVGGGEMTPTIGAVVGGIAGGVLAGVVAVLVILARKKCCKK